MNSSWPAEAKGVGKTEAPRGGLSHWIVIKDGKTENYQQIVPSTWNALLVIQKVSVLLMKVH
jgi:hydrogenase large subunit